MKKIKMYCFDWKKWLEYLFIDFFKNIEIIKTLKSMLCYCLKIPQTYCYKLSDLREVHSLFLFQMWSWFLVPCSLFLIQICEVGYLFLVPYSNVKLVICSLFLISYLFRFDLRYYICWCCCYCCCCRWWERPICTF